MKIRQTQAADVAALQTILAETELFPPEMLPGMLDGSLNDPGESIWLTCEHDGAPVGFCYTVPEQLADGVWNMLAIAVSPDLHGRGAGTAMVEALEGRLREQGQRLLIADTSGLSDFVDTRAFYRARGYREEARVADFWEAGDDKVTFTKAL